MQLKYSNTIRVIFFYFYQLMTQETTTNQWKCYEVTLSIAEPNTVFPMKRKSKYGTKLSYIITSN